MSGPKKSTKAATEMLEVPSVNPLERRLNVLSSPSGSSSQAAASARPCIQPVPRSALLSKLQSFMPQMEAANQKLKEDMQVRPAADFDVENVPEEQQGGYVEMDLACGLLDLKDADALRAAEAALAGQRPDLLAGLGGADASSSDDSDSDSSSSSSSDEGEGGHDGDAEMHEGAADASVLAVPDHGRRLGRGGEAAGLPPGSNLSANALADAPRVAMRRVRKVVKGRAGTGSRKQRPKVTEL